MALERRNQIGLFSAPATLEGMAQLHSISNQSVGACTAVSRLGSKVPQKCIVPLFFIDWAH